MRTKVLLTAVLLIVLVCENAAAPESSTNVDRKLNSDDRPVDGWRLVPVDSSGRPSWQRKGKRKPKRNKHNARRNKKAPRKTKATRKKDGNKNTPRKTKAAKKKDGKSTLVDILSSPQQAAKKGIKKNERYVSIQRRK